MKRNNRLKLTADSWFHTEKNVKRLTYLESVYKVDILSPSPTPPLKGGAILLPSPLRGEGKGEGV